MFRVPVKRSLLVTLLGAVLAALLVLAAPALSLRPYVPKPVSFELAPKPGASTASRGTVLSPVLRTTRRFNLVGLRWRGGGEVTLHLRTRSVDGRWSTWREVDAEALDGPDPGTGERSGGVSAPVWSGEADAVQYRTSRRLPGVRLHFVNTTGTTTAAGRARTALRRSVNQGLVAAGGLVNARAASQPEVVSRSEWGGDQYCAPRRAPSYGTVKNAFVHHTVTTSEYSPEQAPAAVLAICQYHRNSNGWDDIGYNFLVDKYGKIYEGRAGGMDKPVVGAHAQGFNGQSTGIANLGTFSFAPQSSAGLSAMARLIRWKLPLHGAPTNGSVAMTSAGGETNRYAAGTVVSMDRISGHRNGNQTGCPGDSLYNQLPTLRARVGAPANPAARLSLTKPRTPIAAGRVLTLSGRMTPPKPLVHLAVDRKVGRSYRRLTTLSASAANGRFRRGLRLRRTGRYRVLAAFRGDRDQVATRSVTYYLKVVPATGGAAPTRR